jgi:hypothetical protein
MNDEKDRAWADARRDYIYEQAQIRKLAWKVFLSLVLTGLAWRFFGVEVYD